MTPHLNVRNLARLGLIPVMAIAAWKDDWLVVIILAVLAVTGKC